MTGTSDPTTLSSRRLWLWVALLSVLLLGHLAIAPNAHAQDHITERSWLEDPSGQLSWADVQGLPTKPFDQTLNRGYGTGVLWLRLRIDPQLGVGSARQPNGAAAAASQELVLRMRPAYLDRIEVFDPLVPGGRVGVVGDRYHPRQDLMPGADFLLPIARGAAPRELWLRLSSTSTRQIHVAAVSPSDLGRLMTRQSLLASLYIGVVLVMMVWAMVSRVLHGEAVMGAFALMQFTAALFGLSTSGILRVFWPQAWSAEALNLMGSVFSIAVVAGGLLFHVRFLREFQPARWAMGALIGMLALSGVNLVLLASGQVIWALQSNMLSILLAPPICLLCAATGQAWQAAGRAAAPAVSRRMLVSFYLAFLSIFVLSSTTGLGWLPATEWTIYVSQLHTLISSVLLMLMLQYRAFVQARQRQQVQRALERTTLQVAHEREMREEQEQLLAMLAHEIRTPLATMHMRLDQESKSGREIRQALRDMNAVIDRCLQTVQIGEGQLTPELRMHDMTASVRDAVGACSQPDRVRAQLPPQLQVRTDPQLLFIVLNNLLENACKYSAPGTPIELRCGVSQTRSLEQVALLELINLPGSAGWPDPARVFEKYYRSPYAQRQSGTGLGLYLVRKLVQTLGGRIAYRPDEERVRFLLALPLERKA